MIRIANEFQAVRLVELLELADIVDHWEIENTGSDAVDIHVKEFRLDGSVHNFFISDRGSMVSGGVDIWAVIPAQDKQEEATNEK